ncbi:hypothetical protein E3N88_21304 [Mikania micrantha]|uniref:Uncharacterized protein n=1 Tax=Mikania micrantha TaxID=192012 RepID=A0A5N6NJG3_9ASTR|nr:hypothetical protein E3N88_44076 [Mikania micrantha]KAD4889231.1 hypothetical protein E3N88_21304 [Mikania micrantha]
MTNDRNKQKTCLLHTEMVAEPFLAGVLVTDFYSVTGSGFRWGSVSGDGEDDRRSCWLKRREKETGRLVQLGLEMLGFRPAGQRWWWLSVFRGRRGEEEKKKRRERG